MCKLINSVSLDFAQYLILCSKPFVSCGRLGSATGWFDIPVMSILCQSGMNPPKANIIFVFSMSICFVCIHGMHEGCVDLLQCVPATTCFTLF